MKREKKMGRENKAKKNLLPILQASYQNPNEAKETLGNFGYTYDDELSRPNAKVFVDKKGRPNIAYRGSRRVEDWLISDPLTLFGLDKYDKRVTEAKQLTSQVEQKYGKKADTFGHSLGGRDAEISGNHGHTYTYDKAVGLGSLFKTIPKKQYDVRTSNDIVSLAGLTQSHPYDNFKEINLPKQGIIEAHDLKNLAIV
jgi:hypothetical protein